MRIFSSSSLEKESQPFFKIRAGINVIAGFGDNPVPELERFNPDVVLSHNLFPNISTGWLREFGEITFSFKHNYRDICAAGTLYRNKKICLACVESSSINGVINKCYKGSALMSIPITARNSLGVRFRPELYGPRKILVLSNTMKEKMLSTGLGADRFEVIPNFIPDPHAGVLVKGPKNNRWVAAGRLTEEKGFRELIEAWPKNYCLDIYGDGPLLYELQSRFGNTGNVRIKGAVSHKTLLNLLPEYNGAILPSRWLEPGPLTVLEYLASGLPLISIGVWSGAAGLDLSNHVESIDLERDAVSQSLSEKLSALELNLSEISLLQREKYLTHFVPDVWYRRFREIISK